MRSYRFVRDDSKVFSVGMSETGLVRRHVYSLEGSIAGSDLTLIDPETGVDVASMTHNLADTHFGCFAKDGRPLGELAFPRFKAEKRFELRTGGDSWDVRRRGDEYVGVNAKGRTSILIEMDPGLHLFDSAQWLLHVAPEIPDELALLGLAALRQRGD